MATATEFASKRWTIKDSTARFLLLGDRIEFTSIGKKVKVRVIRDKNTVAIGVAKPAKGGLNAIFASRVGLETVPFVAVRFDLPEDSKRLLFAVQPLLDAGLTPDQGGSAAGSGGSSSGGGGGSSSGNGGDGDDEDEEP